MTTTVTKDSLVTEQFTLRQVWENKMVYAPFRYFVSSYVYDKELPLNSS